MARQHWTMSAPEIFLAQWFRVSDRVASVNDHYNDLINERNNKETKSQPADGSKRRDLNI